MAETRSVLGGSVEDYNRSVLGGSDNDYSRSVLGGSDEIFCRSVLGGSDKDYSRSVMGGSEVDYSRSLLGGTKEDLSRTLLGGSDVDHSRTIVSGSDKVMGNPCEPCENDGKNSTAVKYCTDCSEYLCGLCSKNHTKYTAFRHHALKDTEAVKPVINEDTTKIKVTSTDKQPNVAVKSTTVQQRPGQVITSSGAIRNVTANLVSTINVSTSNDNKSPHITDLTMVQTHYCVVIDLYNKSVKVVDTRSGRVTSQIQLSDADDLCSLTSVNHDQVAVLVTIKDVSKIMFSAIKGVRKILLLSTSASGIIRNTQRSIDVKFAYNGITHSNDRFYAANGRRIDVISMQGQIITTFTNKSFNGLSDIAISHDHSTLYVCSFVNDTVFSVDLNGNVTASYKDNDMRDLVGIAVVSDGYVYVCSMGTNCVHQLTADLVKGKVIIMGITVWRCAFNKNDKRLNLNSGNKIKVYNLTYH